MISRVQETETDEALAKRVIGLAMKIHRALGIGFLEAIYANALIIELQRHSIPFEREKIFAVTYDGVEIGTFKADLIIADRLVVELKAVEALAVPHSVQLVNYLSVTKLDFGLLLNFGAKSLEFKTKTRTYQASPVSDSSRHLLP